MSWNRPESKRKEAIRETSHIKKPWGYAILLFVIFVCGLAALLFSIRDGHQQKVKEESRSKKVASYCSTNKAINVKQNITTQGKQSDLNEVENIHDTTNGLLNVSNSDSKHKKRSPTFSSPTEMILVRIFSTRLGHPPPAVPKIPLKDLKNIEEILNRPCEISENDSAKVSEMKRCCNLAKEEFKQFLSDGGDVSEFISHYQHKLQDAFDSWKEAQKVVAQFINAGDREGAEEFVKKVNALHDAKGIRHIMIPGKGGPQ